MKVGDRVTVKQSVIQRDFVSLAQLFKKVGTVEKVLGNVPYPYLVFFDGDKMEGFGAFPFKKDELELIERRKNG